MTPLVWWAIPAVATIGAIAWNSWTHRTRRPVDPLDSIKDFERLRSALAVDPSQQPAAPDRREGDD